MPIYNINKLFDYMYINNNKSLTLNKKSDNYKEFLKKNNLMKEKIIKKMADNINDEFIEKICKDKLNKFLVHSMDCTIGSNITSIIVYRKYNNKSNVRLIILLMAVHPKLRNFGYGNILLDEFIDFYSNKSNKLDIYLHSLESSLYFYLKYGFYQISRNNFLQSYEGWDDNINNEKLLLHYSKCT